MASLPAVDPRTDPVGTARCAGLRYVTDATPGIRRVKRGKGFAYVGADGRLVRNERVLLRIRSLVIPPAWTDVWICPLENGHIQAVGRDARRRKQYRYHPRWGEISNATKFDRMLQFGRALPRIRRRIRRDLARPGLSREKVLAAVITLLEMTLIRVGNDEYAAQNNSFGLTTMRDRHADVTGSTVQFRFRGKSGKEHAVELSDRRLARIVQQCQDLPGQELFQYIDEEGQRKDVTSEDVNNYLREMTGDDFTAKDFRTWAGTVMFVDALRAMDPCRSKAQARRRLTLVIRDVAERLRNTPTVCRNYYIHPFAMQAFSDNSLYDMMDRVCRLERSGTRMPTEALVMRMLELEKRSSRRVRTPAPTHLQNNARAKRVARAAG
jgi:DNA topoisomerase-1